MFDEDVFYSAFVDELDKVALVAGAPKAGFMKRLWASPKALTRAGQTPSRFRKAVHSVPGLARVGKWATTYKPTGLSRNIKEMAGSAAGMVGVNKLMGGGQGQEQQAY